MRPIAERIRERCVETADGCWEWTGTTIKGGYGRIKVGSRTDGSRRSVLVHRAMYEAEVGPIPPGLTLDHLCERPPCCNPAHLVPASIWENTRRSLTSPTAVNARKVDCAQCGGPLTPARSRSGRECRPCRLAYLRHYNATRR